MLRRIPWVVLTAACGNVISQPASDAAAPSADAAADAATDVSLDAAPDAAPSLELAVEPDVVWTSGSFPVDAGASAQRACFLQQVAGMFKAPDHFVHVDVVGAKWLVTGSAAPDQQTRVRCVTYGAASGISVSPQLSWTQGQAAVDLGPADDRLCGLTSVAGTYNGGGELVHAIVEGGRWVLRGTSAATGVSASARCLVFPTGTGVAFEGEVLWAQGNPPTTLGPIAGRACLLTLFVGSFLGGAESVGIIAAGDTWVLGGSSGQTGVAARARCVTWP